MRSPFRGTPDPNAAADAFLLEFLARRKGSPGNIRPIWKSLRFRGRVSPGGPPAAAGALPEIDADTDRAATGEILRRLEAWRNEGPIGGEIDPETIPEERHFWFLGHEARRR